MSQPPLLIAGAGIAGMSLALALARKGLQSQLLERRAGPTADGAGIQLGPNAMRVLQRLGVAEQLAAFTGAPDAINVFDGYSRRQLASLPLVRDPPDLAGVAYCVAHRADLQDVLLNAVKRERLVSVTAGFEVDAVVQQDDCIDVQSTDGQVVRGPALIGADGLWSSVRRSLFPGLDLGYAGKMAARTVFSMAGRKLPTVQLSKVDKQSRGFPTAVWLGTNAHVVLYGLRGGQDCAAVVIVDEAQAREGWGGPIVSETVLERISGFPDELRAFLGAGDNWQAWSLYNPVALPSWCRGRATLLGDAAQPILPFLAQGGAMAIEGAETLATALCNTPDNPVRAFKAYEAVRRHRVLRVQTASRRNGRIFHMRGAARLARNLVLSRMPGAKVMRRYDWLYSWDGDQIF